MYTYPYNHIDVASSTLVYGQHRWRTPSSSGIPSCRTLFLYTHTNWAHLHLLYQYFLCLSMGTCSYFLNTRVVGKCLTTEFEFTQMYMGFFGRNGKRSWHKRHFFIMLLILLNELTNYEAFLLKETRRVSDGALKSKTSCYIEIPTAPRRPNIT